MGLVLRRRFGRTETRRGRRRGPTAGLSLLETLIATAALLLLTIGLLPLLTRSSLNTIAGLDASRASQHARSEVEDLAVLGFDHTTLDLETPLPSHVIQASTEGQSGQEMLLPEEYWDDGRDSLVDGQVRLGDGGWVDDRNTARGTVFWRRRSTVRAYSYADVSSGVIDVTDSGQLSNVGHPHVFDYPLDADAPVSLRHFKEEDIEVVNQRAGGEDLGIGGLRLRFMRVY